MSQHLKEALEAGIWLCTAQSRDVFNDVHVIGTICTQLKKVGMHHHQLDNLGNIGKTGKGSVIALTELKVPLPDLMDWCTEMNRQVVILTRPGDEPIKGIECVYDTGMLMPPDEAVAECFGDIVPSEQIPALVACLKGLQLYDVPTVVKVTLHRDKKLTQEGLLLTRSQILSKVQGLAVLDTAMTFYEENTELAKWVWLNSRGFKKSNHEKLVPRGLLLAGQPGTGKTSAARYIANKFGLPLIQFDLGAMMGKYVGESESKLTEALLAVETMAPCVLLMDEVEKMLAGEGDVVPRLLAKLLWWLQERKGRIITVMTTNNRLKLPEELYRPGRIDAVIDFEGLNGLEEITLFMHRLHESWEGSDMIRPSTIDMTTMPVKVLESWTTSDAGKVHQKPSHVFATSFYETELKRLNFTQP